MGPMILAEHCLAEAMLIVQLLWIQAEKAEQRLEAINLSVGQVCLVICNSGYSPYPKLWHNDTGGHACKCDISHSKPTIPDNWGCIAVPQPYSGHYDIIAVLDWCSTKIVLLLLFMNVLPLLHVECEHLSHSVHIAMPMQKGLYTSPYDLSLLSSHSVPHHTVLCMSLHSMAQPPFYTLLALP